MFMLAYKEEKDIIIQYESVCSHNRWLYQYSATATVTVTATGSIIKRVSQTYTQTHTKRIENSIDKK